MVWIEPLAHPETPSRALDVARDSSRNDFQKTRGHHRCLCDAKGANSIFGFNGFEQLGEKPRKKHATVFRN